MAGFEIDGNLCVNTAGDSDWSSTPGQPVQRDGFGDSTQFSSGASESSWPWQTGQISSSGTATGGSDIGDVYATTEVSANQVYVFLGIQRGVITGSQLYVIELNQQPNMPITTTSGLQGPTPNRTTGDLRIVLSEAGQGAISLSSAWTWTSTGANSGSWGQIPLPSAAVLAGATNSVAVSDLQGGTYAANTFTEVGINLSQLFTGAGVSNCSGDYGTLNLRSLSGGSINSSLGDWVAPTPLDVPSTCSSLVVNKSWDIDGTTFPNGTQPAGFDSTLSLDPAPLLPAGQTDPSFGVTYDTVADGTRYQAGSSLTIGETVVVPPGCTNTATGDAGTQTLVPGVNTFQITNVVTCTRLTLQKVVNGGTADPQDWTLTADGPTAGVSGPSGSDAVTAAIVAPGTYGLSESGPTNYQLQSLSCTDASGASVPVTDNAIDVVQGANVTCTFTNAAVYPVTLTKVWHNPVTGDAVRLTITAGANTANGTSTAPDTTTPATLNVVAGETVGLSETFTTGSESNYNTTLACDTVTVSPATGTSGSFTAPTTPAAGTPITCTFTNARMQARLILQKTWVNGAANDTSVISITGSDPLTANPRDTATAQASGVAGSQTDTTHRAVAPIFIGETVTVTEVLGTANLGTYDPTLSCVEETSGAAVATTPATGPPGTSGSFTVPATPVNVVCTFTNSRTMATVTYLKAWDNAVQGDTTTLSISATSPGTAAAPDANAMSTATGASGLETDTTHPATAPIFSGDTVTVNEALGATSTGAYIPTTTCTGATDFTEATGGAGGTFTVPSTPTDVTCTSTNTLTATGQLFLRKDWVNGATNDTAALSATGSVASGNATATVPTGGSGLSVNRVRVGTAALETIDLSETLPTGNTGTYTTTLTCNRPGLTLTGADGRSGQFEVSAAIATQTIICTFTNTRTEANLTLQKTWVNGATNDTAQLGVAGTDPATSAGPDAMVTSTATGAAGSETDTTNVARGPIFSGETVGVVEELGATNTGTYDTTLVCTDAAGATVTTADTTTGMFTVGATATDVTCTFTNTRTMAMLTVQKTWVNGAANDTAALSVTSTDAGTHGSATSTATGAAGSETDTTAGHFITTPIFSGGTVTVTETLGTNNRGAYTSVLSCTNGSIATTMNTTGSFTVPDPPVTDTCTFTNVRTSSTLVVLKHWVNGAANDTATLNVSGTNPTASTSATAIAAGVPGGQTDTATGHFIDTTIFSGQSVTVSEAFGTNNTGTYTPHLACTNGQTADATSADFTVGANPAATTFCTFTNTRTSATVNLTKVWENPITGNAVTLRIDGGFGESATGSSIAPDQTNPASLVVFSGDMVSVTETFTQGLQANYTTDLSCTNRTTSSTTLGSFTVPSTPVDVTCTFTNSRNSATLILQKEWVNGVEGDTADLQISSAGLVRDAPDVLGSATSTATGAAGSELDTTDVARATVFAGQAVMLNEVLGSANRGAYASTMACDPATGFTEGTGGQAGTLVVPSNPVDAVCTVTNTRQVTGTLTLQKAWLNGAPNDSANLSATGLLDAGTTTATVPVGGNGTSDDKVVINVASGETVNLSEALPTGNLGTYTSALTCDQSGLTPAADGRSGTFEVPTGMVSVTCTFTNTRTQAMLTLHKAWDNGVADDTAALSISATTAGTAAAPEANVTSTATGAAGLETDDTNVASAPIFSGDTVTVSETYGDTNTGAYTATTTCTGAPDFTQATGGEGGTLTVPSTPTDVTCTITNTRSETGLLILRKHWVNGATGDTAVLSVSSPLEPGGTSATATVPASGNGLSVARVRIGTAAAETIDLSETLPSANTGTYTSTLSCNRPGLTVTGADGRSGSFAVTPAVATEAVLCTFTNTRTQASLTLQKEWVNGAESDTAALSISGSNPVVAGAATSTATGAAGPELDTTDVAMATIYSGQRINLAERLGIANTGGYTSAIACTPSTGFTPDPGGMTGTLAVGANPADVTCTVTNTRSTATLTLRKEWVNGFDGDSAALSISGSDPATTATATSSATGAAGSEIDTTHVASASIFSGESVDLAETLGADNTGTYTSTIACDQPGLTPGQGGNGTFIVSALEPIDVTCTITNTRTEATLTVRKEWINGAAGDTAALSIKGPDPATTGSATSTATGSAGTELDTTDLASAPIFSGVTVDVSEALGTTNTGAYTTTLSCTNGFTATGVTGSFAVPATPDDVVCTFINTRTQATITVQKEWVDGVTGDTAALSIGGSDTATTGSATSTATGATGSELDTTDVATAPIFSGGTVDIDEELGANNAGAYTTTTTCTPSTNFRAGAGGQGGTIIHVPTPPVDITCTVTNTRSATGELTLEKNWVNGATNDTANLSATGVVAAGTALAVVPDHGNGTSVDKVVIPIASGETVNLAETLGGTNTGTYTSALECTQPGLTAATDGRSGTFDVTSNPEPVTCTFTNTRTEATLTLQKEWVNGAAGDTTALSIAGSDPATSDATSATATSAASGVAGSETDTTNVAMAPIFSGDRVTVTEGLNPDNTGTYTSALSCTNGTTSTTSTGTFTIPETPTDVTCTFTNTRTTATLRLQKVWDNAVGGDTASLSISGMAPATTGSATSTATGAVGLEPDTTDVASAPIFSGDTVTVSEAFGDHNTGAYTASTTCSGTADFTEADGGQGGTLAVPTTPTDVTCTITNTRSETGLLILRKDWTNGATGDTAVLSATSELESGSTTATVPTGGNGLSVVRVRIGTAAAETIDLSETLPTANTGTYTSTLACNRPGLTVTGADGRSGSFAVTGAVATQTVVCTFTNTRTQATLTLQKEWVNGAEGDTTDLSISGTNPATTGSATSTATGAAGRETDTTNVATAAVFSGQRVDLAETFGTANKGSYDSALACDGTPNTGTLTIPATPTDMTCTFTNTRTQATITLRKEWINGVAGDRAALSISGSDPATTGSATSTATGATGSELDTTNVATAPIFSGGSVNVGEELDASNKGAYTSTVACDPSSSNLRAGTGGEAATITVPAIPVDVTCTITNTRSTTGELTLQKTWVNGEPNDTATLTATGLLDSGTTTATVPDGGNGTSVDRVVISIASGETVNLSETLPTTNVGTYGTRLTCDEAGLTAAADNLSGTFDVPAAPTNITCTFTNAHAEAFLTLHKEWVNGKAGDTAGLTISGTDAATTGSATSTATGATGSETDTTNVATAPVFSGESVHLAETLGTANKGSYDSSLSCDGTPSTGTLTIPAQPTDITCTFTNTRRMAMLTLRVRWINAIVGDSSTITATSTTDPSATATVPPGGNGLSANTVTVPIFSGGTANLQGVLAPTNVGAYSSTIDCDQPTLVAAANGQSGVYHVPTNPVNDVICTLTKTRNVPPAAHPSVAKRIASITAGTTAGQWTITYEVTATNPGTTDLVYSLTDNRGFPVGITVTSTHVTLVTSALDGSGPSAPTVIPTGSPLVLATNRTLAAQSVDTYTVVVGATVPSSLAADVLACNATAGAGHGWFNSVSLGSGGGQFTAQACDPITPTSPPAPPAPAPAAPAPPPPGPATPPPVVPPELAVTGLLLTGYVQVAAALLALGGLTTYLSRRRRSRGRHYVR